MTVGVGDESSGRAPNAGLVPHRQKLRILLLGGLKIDASDRYSRYGTAVFVGTVSGATIL